MPFSLSLSVAGVGFTLSLPEPVPVNESFRPFLSEPASENWSIVYEPVVQLPLPAARPLSSEQEYLEYPSEPGTLLRAFLDPIHGSEPFAVSLVKREGKTVNVRFRADRPANVTELSNTFVYSCWESLLLWERRLILHASLVATRFGGILFSGVSGIGKSTQADLWVRHENARLINGDRPVLAPSGERWLACGSPYAGSSHLHLQETVPVRVIVLLKQAPVNTLRRLSAAEAFHGIYPGVACNSVSPELMDLRLTLIEQLALSVPVYELACLPDVSAVEILSAELEKEVAP